MPIFTLASQCYMLPSGFYVVAEIGRGEKILSSPTGPPVITDTDMQQVRDALSGVSTGSIYPMYHNGRVLMVSTDVADTDPEVLADFQSAVDGSDWYASFTDAVWSAGSPVSTVTMDQAQTFSESDREAVEVAVHKAMQYMGMYYDIASVVRENPVITVTLDESQKPYDAGWDSVWAETAAMFGGELP